ncbi:HAD-IA family hydrolase [Paenibacillus lemnae]|uniref:HAD-IA family hydrolase n=1 Tax=Paenibacillus lemnae TaxID=1330551 RepID=A0A848M7P7_PAELE|nr:HAD-IA family hydrolase [Paenibacillus lemnae]NMO97027.1 HAD-IA family hydrolase [Paenibacillus lemnae]
MRARPQLVLDLAGVLISNFSPTFWPRLENESGATFQEMKQQFGYIRKDLWTGKLREKDFWIWLGSRLEQIPQEEAQRWLISALKPLPALQQLERWSEAADIHILSNHCQEWLEHLLPLIEPFAESVTVSNQVGLCKPEPEIYTLVSHHFGELNEEIDILYVDDQDKNLEPARQLGWKTLLADPEHRWISIVEQYLFRSVVEDH